MFGLTKQNKMKLSIVIAAYNVELFIEKCIKSCYDERYIRQYEIIIINDGSTDTTALVAQKLINQIPNLKIINKTNEGLGAARNSGIKEASAEYIWMIDGDDFLKYNSLKTIISILSSQEYDCYAFNYNIVNANYDLISIKYPSEYIKKVLSGSSYYDQYFQNSYTWQYVFRRELFTNNQLKFQERINMQDTEILPKIMYHTKSVRYIDKVQYNYVQQENSFTNTKNAQKRINYFESIITVKSSLESFAKEIQFKDPVLYQGIQKKIISLHEVVFNHLVFFDYSNTTFKHIINLLKLYNFYPLKYNPIGKLKWVKIGLNIDPQLAKKIINLIRK